MLKTWKMLLLLSTSLVGMLVMLDLPYQHLNDNVVLPNVPKSTLDVAHFYNGDAPDGSYSMQVVLVDVSVVTNPFNESPFVLLGKWRYQKDLSFRCGVYLMTVHAGMIVSAVTI